MATVPPLTVADGISNLTREASARLHHLALLRDTGSSYEDGTLARSDLMRALDDLAAGAMVQGFRQVDFRDLARERLDRWDLERDVAAPLREMGGGVYFQFAPMLLRLTNGGIDDPDMARFVDACRHILLTDTRPEWKRRNWNGRAWELSSDLLAACYWMDSRDLALETLRKRWMPGAKSVEEWNDVPTVWTRKRMEWLDFAFWRHWWVRELGLRPNEHLSLEHVIAHGLCFFGDIGKGYPGLGDYMAMAHAEFFPRRWPMEVRTIVERLVSVEPRPWK